MTRPTRPTRQSRRLPLLLPLLLAALLPLAGCGGGEPVQQDDPEVIETQEIEPAPIAPPAEDVQEPDPGVALEDYAGGEPPAAPEPTAGEDGASSDPDSMNGGGSTARDDEGQGRGGGR